MIRRFIIFIAAVFLLLPAGAEEREQGVCGLPPVELLGKRYYTDKTTSWKNGSEIDIYFQNGSDEKRVYTEHVIREWERYANLSFNFPEGPKTDDELSVVIQFTELEGNTVGMSYIGSGSISFEHPSIWLEANAGAGTILHEFGHTLGFLHEMMNPFIEYEWNEEAVIGFCEGMYGWSEEQTRNSLFDREVNEYSNYGRFDPLSVMNYWFPSGLFKEGKAVGGNLVFYLSRGDAAGAARLYPGKNNDYRFPITLFDDSKPFELRTWGQNGRVEIYLNEKLLYEAEFNRDYEEKFSIFPGEALDPDDFNKIYAIFTPFEEEEEWTCNFYPSYHFYASEDEDYFYTEDGRIFMPGAYLTGKSNSNRGRTGYDDGLDAIYGQAEGDDLLLSSDGKKIEVSWHLEDYENEISSQENNPAPGPVPGPVPAPVPTPAPSPEPEQVIGVDSVMRWGEEHFYMFKDGLYLRYEKDKERVDERYPREVTDEYWEGLSFDKIDATVNWDNGKIYFFSGNEYIRYDKDLDAADPGYPKEINNRTWPGLGFETIDAAVNGGNGKAYFFRGNEYVQYDIEKDQADSGYPREINDENWPTIGFDHIDGAFSHRDKYIYFFCGDEWTRFLVDYHMTIFPEPVKIKDYWPGVAF